jgi:hypothetical protein
VLNGDKNPLSKDYFKCAFETYVGNYTMTNAVFYGYVVALNTEDNSSENIE